MHRVVVANVADGFIAAVIVGDTTVAYRFGDARSQPPLTLPVPHSCLSKHFEMDVHLRY